MKKNLVLDTNVLLTNPQVLFTLGKNNVYVPIPVLEELDKFKSGHSLLNHSARQVNRNIDKVRKMALEQGSSLKKGVKVEGGGKVFVLSDYPEVIEVHPGLDSSKMDNIILAMALQLSKKSKRKTVLVSKDCNMRVKADAMGLPSEDYEQSVVIDKTIYNPIPYLEIEESVLSNLVQSFNDTGFGDPASISSKDFKEKIYEGQYVHVHSKDYLDPFPVSLEKNPHRKGEFFLNMVAPSINPSKGVFNLQPKNLEQVCALDALLDQEVHCVSLVGKAGTGKTLLAMAAGLEQAVNKNKYERVMVYRPIVPMGKDIGYLPGTEREKLDPYMRVLTDCFDVLMPNSGPRMKGGNATRQMEDMGKLVIEALTYIRGRSIKNAYIVIDEAQNLTINELKTILTRLGKGSKIVFTGDPYQIDHDYLDSHSNGLSHLIHKWKEEPLYRNINLHVGERSDIAELASNTI